MCGQIDDQKEPRVQHREGQDLLRAIVLTLGADGLRSRANWR